MSDDASDDTIAASVQNMLHRDRARVVTKPATMALDDTIDPDAVTPAFLTEADAATVIVHALEGRTHAQMARMLASACALLGFYDGAVALQQTQQEKKP